MKIRIIGSIFFLNKFEEAKRFLQKQGHEVILPEKDSTPEPIPPSLKRKAMYKFNEDLKESDAILVINYTKNGKENYIGANTLMEIEMAFITNKRVFVLNPAPEFCRNELEAIGTHFLNGNLDKIK